MESLLMKAQELLELLQTCPLVEFLTTHQVPAAQYIKQVMTTLPRPYETRKIALMLYVMYLIQFFHMRFPLHVASAAHLAENINVPHVVVVHILNLFTEMSMNATSGKPRYDKQRQQYHHYHISRVRRGIYKYIYITSTTSSSYVCSFCGKDIMNNNTQ